jgi:hypothetical protein
MIPQTDLSECAEVPFLHLARTQLQASFRPWDLPRIDLSVSKEHSVDGCRKNSATGTPHFDNSWGKSGNNRRGGHLPSQSKAVHLTPRVRAA